MPDLENQTPDVAPTISINGEVVGAGGAKISVLDHGYTVGDGVFETCKIVDGEAFAWARHLRRLQRSMQLLGLADPGAQLITDAVERTLAAAVAESPLNASGRLRLTVSSGSGPLGSGRGDASATVVVVVSPAAPWPAHVSVITVPWPRNERSAIVGAKSTSYAENVVAVQAAHARGAGEALMGNLAGALCEGTGSNVAVAVGGELITPPLSSGCLAGITRELLLEWAQSEGLAVHERDLPFGVLTSAEDVVLLSSTRDVQRVHELDGRPLVGGALGDAAIALFERCSAGNSQP